MSHDDPGLLHFLLARLDEEEELILWSTPIFATPALNPEFEDHLVGRGALIGRTRLDRELASACVESMTRVQGPPPVPLPDGSADEATVLGSAILKGLAARFAWHANYQGHWRP